MDERRVVFQRLYQIRQQRIPEQGRHCAVRTKFTGGHGLLAAGIADDDCAESFLQFGQVLRQAEDRHDFGGAGDIEARLPGHAMGGSAEADGGLAQRAVVHVHHAPPCDPARVQIRICVPVDVVVDQGRQQVVSGCDGVEIAGEMQIYVGHGRDLRVTAACRSTLHAEAWAETGFAQADRGLLADAVQRVAKTDRRRGLALAGRGRRNGCYQDQLARCVRPRGIHGGDVDLGLGAAERNRMIGEAELAGDLAYRKQTGLAGNFNI